MSSLRVMSKNASCSRLLNGVELHWQLGKLDLNMEGETKLQIESSGLFHSSGVMGLSVCTHYMYVSCDLTAELIGASISFVGF